MSTPHPRSVRRRRAYSWHTVEHVEQRVLLGAGLCGGPVPG